MVNGQIVKKHDYITIDGSTGNVIIESGLIDAEISEDLKQILLWADEIRTLGVRQTQTLLQMQVLPAN